jgi:hypothetical protein
MNYENKKSNITEEFDCWFHLANSESLLTKLQINKRKVEGAALYQGENNQRTK